MVHVLYCSGDLHAGNVTRPYADAAGEPVVLTPDPDPGPDPGPDP